ncbi:putative RNA recognition motif domain-containing protein [Lupinus albus]|uniref:Putative RNA recognition motif domain-containing protein n=1 Tax=Lupinus albus TaxID=3870 RepID=A0A6A4QWU5_LUPAL|nr:putative RNA recognition motif domain-containing protein [Lupinus albus]
MAEPSKVIHIRNVGQEISEDDLLQLFQSFGVITKLVMLRAKNQALIQMQDVDTAASALQFYENIQPNIRGRNVYIQFSSHQDLAPTDQNQGRGDEVGIFVTKLWAPFLGIVPLILHVLFSPCILLLLYQTVLIQWVQFVMFNSFFVIFIIYFSIHNPFSVSALSQCCCAAGNSLDVQPNRILLVTIHHVLYPMTADVLHQVFSPHGSVEKIVTFYKSAGCQALIQYQSRQSAVTAKNALQGRNVYDGCCQLDIQFSNLDELQVNYNNDRSRDFTNPNLPTEQKGRPSQPDAGNMYGSAARAVGLSHVANADAIAAAFGGNFPPGVTGENDRCTILVSNLNPDRIDEDKLFNLFSIYGNIVRIKLLWNKPDHALVQMGDGFQAELAVHFLKGAMLFGKRLEVNFSKHATILQGADTHEYGNSNLNRFNHNAAKNYRYCCYPTWMIHLCTLPQDITEEDIVDLVEDHGVILKCKVFEMNGKKQALVQFETEEQATEALVCKHATSISGSVVRISFSQLHNI